MMTGIALSDLHGYLPKIEEAFDLMLLPGDVCPVRDHRRPFQENWIKTDFAEWVKSLPFKNETSRVIMCGGNHDVCLEGMSHSRKKEIEAAAGGRLEILENEGTVVTINEGEEDGFVDYQVFATPYCKRFGNWAFMRDYDRLDKYYSFIPSGMDFVISHDAADINGLGLISLGPYSGTNAGNKILAEHIKRAKPKYYFCGHIHSGNHSLTDVDGTKMANVSIMDESYYPSNPPLIFEYSK